MLCLRPVLITHRKQKLMNFEFATADTIVFGTGILKGSGSRIKAYGNKALLVTFRTLDRAQPILNLLEQVGVDYEILSVPNEPTIELADEGLRIVRERQCDMVIGYGGGSAIDTAKAIAGLATNPGEALDYLEVIGRGQKLTQDPMPFIAIPTTAGTGAEVTRNAVLKSEEHKVKVSLRSPLMLANLAIVDPELTHSVPKAVTASTGMDALTQVLEPYVCNKMNPMTDALCREGMARAARSLRRAYEQGDDAAAREDMAITSLFGGLALANAKLGAVHGFAGPLGGMYAAPHGAICAILLPPVMAANVQALRERDPDSIYLKRYDEIGRILTGSDKAVAQDGVEWVKDLGEALAIPALSEYGIKSEHFPTIIEKAQQASSMTGNPLVLTDAEREAILEQAL